MTSPVVIITGASRGLGEAAARITAHLDAKVVLTARSPRQLDRVAQEIQNAGGTALAIRADVSAAEDCQTIVDKTLASFGRLDALVNNAGILGPIATFTNADPSAWARNLEINLFGPVNLTRAALPYLRAFHGRVIHISTGAALEPYHGFSAYSVSKAALNQFNRALALEEPRVTSIALRPGKVDTDMQELLRREGAAGMITEQYEEHVLLHSRGDLLPPHEPGRSIALLALFAPPEWSGQFLKWDDPRIRTLGQHSHP